MKRVNSKGNPWHDDRGRFCHGPIGTVDCDIEIETQMNRPMKTEKWESVSRKRIEFEDDVVVVYDDDEDEVYKGLEDYEPMRDESWKWDNSSQTYRLGNYRKVCLDI